ncbi:MAG: hypothetical protein VW169_10065 [Rhodospirillaceae bacterium]
MDHGIRAVWYDLPEDGRQDYLDWLHNAHLPLVQQQPGISWAAHYEITGGGAKLYEDHDVTEDIFQRPEEDIGNGTDFLLLIGAGSPHLFFKPPFHEWELEESGAKEMIGMRIGARPVVFTEEARVNGPEFDARAQSATPGPAIQMGNFRTRSVEDEFDLAAWYANYRFPAMAKMTGCINTRKLVSVAGWVKHSILYEFTSLEARAEGFDEHEALGLDNTVWTSKIVKYTIHAPGSPSVGRRIWPAVD